MKMVFNIPFRLPSLNEYINECRSNKYGGANYKKEIENNIMWCLPKVVIDKPIYLKFTWYEPNRKRDKDNVCFAKKFILDAMQKKGIIKNDNNKFVLGFMDMFEYGGEAHVTVEVEEEM